MQTLLEELMSIFENSICDKQKHSRNDALCIKHNIYIYQYYIDRIPPSLACLIHYRESLGKFPIIVRRSKAKQITAHIRKESSYYWCEKLHFGSIHLDITEPEYFPFPYTMLYDLVWHHQSLKGWIKLFSHTNFCYS